MSVETGFHPPQEVKETPAKIDVEIFFSAHANEADGKAIQKYLSGCDVFIPEQIGWSEADRDVFNKVAQGEIAPVDALKLLENTGYSDFTKGQLEALYQTKKTVEFVDTPKGQPYSSVIDFYDNLEPFFENFDDAINTLKESQQRFITNYGTNREKLMQDRLGELMQNLAANNPGKNLKILMQLGYNHRPFYKDLKASAGENFEFSAKYPVSDFPYAYSDEFGARYLNNKEIDKDLLAKCWLERKIEKILPIPDDSVKYIKYIRQITGAFTVVEISDIYDKIKGGQAFEQIFISMSEQKGFSLPTIKEDWDKIKTPVERDQTVH